ncbi:anti-sigma factor family protein [Sunxiuqinia sp. A32]|uniref:anti-sigma factor family protein n=1 Tax=Sunxiuqinia sp. A32 TaxID=3461496 RepID=UPI0040465E8A
MKHKEVKNQLVYYLEGSLSASQIVNIDLHLKDCEGCRFYLQELEKDFTVMLSEKEVENDPYFFTRLKAKMDAPAEKRTFKLTPILQTALFALFLIISIGGGIEIGKQLHHQPNSGQNDALVLLPFDGVNEEPIEQFLLTLE